MDAAEFQATGIGKHPLAETITRLESLHGVFQGEIQSARLVPFWTMGYNHENPLTGTPAGHADIFLETNRDQTWNDVPAGSFFNAAGAAGLRLRYYNRVIVTLAHELAHPPGLKKAGDDHNEGASELGGIMRNGAPDGDRRFVPITIKRLRTAASWTSAAP